jgi:hypothetical protein
MTEGGKRLKGVKLEHVLPPVNERTFYYNMR